MRGTTDKMAQSETKMKCPHCGNSIIDKPCHPMGTVLVCLPCWEKTIEQTAKEGLPL